MPDFPSGFSVAARSVGPEPWDVADLKLHRTLPFLATERSRVISAEPPSLADGTYDVLATLDAGGRQYRVLAELRVNGGSSVLRFFRFELPTQDEWFSERRISVPLTGPEITRLPQKVAGADFVLSTPVKLDEERAEVVFGVSGPPAV